MVRKSFVTPTTGKLTKGMEVNTAEFQLFMYQRLELTRVTYETHIRWSSVEQIPNPNHAIFLYRVMCQKL
jgi:hypothetical protein